jgi:hypothetical protein
MRSPGRPARAGRPGAEARRLSADGALFIGRIKSFVLEETVVIPPSPDAAEEAMNEDRLNMDIRKFLKIVGVTSQREIERAVRAALANGTLAETALLRPQVRLSIPEIGLDHLVDCEIGLS